MSVRSLAIVLCSTVAAGGLVGCSNSAQISDARGVAVRFVRDVQSKDGRAACDLLTPDARSSASGATNTPCTQAVLNLDESGTAVHTVQVWGDAAEVKLGSDVIFLRRLEPGWRVRAAGCMPKPHAPYDCDVKG